MENSPNVIRAIVSAYARSVGSVAESNEILPLQEMGPVEGFETSTLRGENKFNFIFKAVRRMLYLAAQNLNVSASLRKVSGAAKNALVINGVELPGLPAETNSKGAVNYYFSGLEVAMGRRTFDEETFVESSGAFSPTFARKVLAQVLKDIQTGTFPPNVEGTAPPSIGGAGVAPGTPESPEEPAGPSRPVQIEEPERPAEPKRESKSFAVATGWTPKRTAVDTVSEFANWEQAVRQGAEKRVAVYAEALDRALLYIQDQNPRLYDQLVEQVQRASSDDFASGSKIPNAPVSGKIDTSLELDTLVQAAFDHKEGRTFQEVDIAESFSAKFGRRVAPETIGNLVKSVANSHMHPTGLHDVHDAVAAFSTESGLHDTTAKNVSGLMKDVASAPANSSRAPYRTRALTIGSSMTIQ